MGSFQGCNMWHYSQQDLIDSGLGGGKASSDKGEEKSSHNLTIWLLCFLYLGPFFSFPFLATCAAHFVHFYAIRAVTEMMQGRTKTKENSQLVLNTTTGLPLSSTFYIFPSLVLSECRTLVVKHGVFLLQLCLLFLSSPFEFLSALTGG